ncbi:MAG: phosphoserine aminotransferase [Acidimicrobiales bacterium]|jgi:phosphoserine aminotransferase
MGCELTSCQTVSQTTPNISIPSALLPSDGRFGSGPSKVRPEAVAALAEIAPTYLGTSHRQATVKDTVGRLRDGLSALFDLPDGWEVVLGNGGSTIFWDAATFGLVEARSQHLVFGEFSSKFAAETDAAPFLGDPQIISSDPGSHPTPVGSDDVDFYALTHNETSTGVMAPMKRPAGSTAKSLVAADATSAAGALRWDPAEVDCYYFAPQKALASDGGLWIACCSPATIERIGAIEAGPRWIPAGLNLATALDNSTKNQTYNTPSLATLFLAAHQVEWLNNSGGMDFSAGRSEQSAHILYSWAAASGYATPYVTEPAQRSNVVGTIDLDDRVEASTVSAVLRANGIVDTDSYRKLGRNQLRIAMFPAIEPTDIEALTACIDYVVGELS